MNRFRKKCCLILAILLFLCVGIWTPAKQVEAAGIQVYIALSANTVSVGDSVTVTVSVVGDTVSRLKMSLSYPSDLLEFTSGSSHVSGGNGSIAIDLSNGGDASMTFKALAGGTARMSTRNDDAVTESGEKVSVNHAGVKVEIKGTGTPTTKKTETATEKKTEKKSEDGEEASTEEAAELVFADDLTVEVNGVSYNIIQPEPELIPEGYSLVKERFKAMDIPAYISPNQVIKLVALSVGGGNTAWYRIVDTEETLVPYVEYTASPTRYILLDKPSTVALPEGYAEDSEDLGFGPVTVYASKEDPDRVLVYGVTIDGHEGLYIFDRVERSFSRYVRIAEPAKEEVTTEKKTEEPKPLPDEQRQTKKDEEGIFTRDNLIKMLIGALALFLVMAILAMVLLIKNGKLQSAMADEEQEEDLNERAVRRAKADAEAAAQTEEYPEEYPEENSGEAEEPKKSEVTGETIEILLEEAADNNQSVHVPPAEDAPRKSVEEVMKSRPYGIDSAFEVKEAEDVTNSPEPVDREADLHVKSEKSQRVDLPVETEEEDE